MLPAQAKTMLIKDKLPRHNKEMTEEVNVKKLLMTINKEEPPEIKIDKQSVT
jgi:hypothetical protein